MAADDVPSGSDDRRRCRRVVGMAPVKPPYMVWIEFKGRKKDD